MKLCLSVIFGFVLLAAVATNSIAGQVGCEDFSFGPGLSVSASVISALPDGGFLAAGPGGLEKFNVDGVRDLKFRPEFGGYRFPNGSVVAVPQVTCLTAWPGGGWIVAGYLSFTNDGVVRRSVAKLFSDGTIDTNYFASFPGFANITCAILDEQKRLLVGGSFAIDGYTNLVRFQADGTIDTSLARNDVNGIEGTVAGLALQNPGSKVIVSARMRRGGQLRFMGRFFPDGRPDLAFENTIGCDMGPVVVQKDGKIVYVDCGGTGPARLEMDGASDESWANPYFWFVNSLQAAPNGDLLITGRINRVQQVDIYALGVMRGEESSFGLYAVSSSEVTGFRVGGIGPAVFTHNGDILTAIQYGSVNSGPFDPLGGGMARVKAGRSEFDRGSLSMVTAWLGDTTAFIPFFTDLLLLPDGRSIVSGAFEQFGHRERRNLVRLHTDGKMDSSFAPPPSMDGGIQTLCLLTNGQFLAGGWFTQIAGRTQGGLARFHGDGRFDETFMSGLSGVAGSSVPTVSGLAVLPDDQKILAGGTFTTVHGVARPYLARLQPDGRLDPSFLSAASAGPNSPVRRVVVQPDGRILIGGGFSRVSGVSRDLLARLWPDGRLDESFDAHLGTNVNGAQVIDLELLPDGRILVAGLFSPIQETGPSHLARLHPDGGVDSGFQVRVSGPDPVVNFVEVQPDGKYVVGGKFESVNESAIAGLVRLHPDGTVDPFGTFCRTRPSRCWKGRLQPDGGLLLIDTEHPLGLSRVSGDAPPYFTRPLTNRVISAGANTALSVATFSTAPLHYQWQVADTAIAGTNQTNSILLNRVDYDTPVQVTVSNVFGGLATSRAEVKVFYESANEIPPLAGAALERLSVDGPEIEPTRAANWIAGRLFAIDPGPVTVRWRDGAGNPLVGTARIVGRMVAGDRLEAGLNEVDARGLDGRLADQFALAGDLDGEHRIYWRALDGWSGRIALRSGPSGPVLASADATGDVAAISISFTNRPSTNLSLTVTSVETNGSGRYEVGLYPVARPGVRVVGTLDLSDPWSVTRAGAVGQGRWYHDDYWLAGVQPGDRVIVRVISGELNPFLELRLLAPESVLQFSDGSSLESTVQGVAGLARDYVIRVTSRESEVRGGYTLSVDRAGAAPVIRTFAPVAGTPGTRVTVRGGNFVDGQEVSFDEVTLGGVAAPSLEPVVRGDEQEFELVVPPGARTGPIRLHRLQALLAASSNDFAVLAPVGGVRREPGGRLSFAITNVGAGAMVIEAATNLSPPVAWRGLQTNAGNSPGPGSYTNEIDRSKAEQFFRVKVQ